MVSQIIRSKKLKYAVVEFTEEDEVEVVPVGWLADGGNKCNWPNIRSTAKISSLIKADVAPKDDFKLLPIRVLAKTGMILPFILCTRMFRETQKLCMTILILLPGVIKDIIL